MFLVGERVINVYEPVELVARVEERFDGFGEPRSYLVRLEDDETTRVWEESDMTDAPVAT